MADIQLRIQGEDRASGTLRDVAAETRNLGDESKKMAQDAGDAAGKTAASYVAVLDVLKSLTAAIIDFGKESVHAFAEADRIGRQLERTVGDMAGAFSDQAKAISDLTGIDDDNIKTMQIMLAQWGMAPTQIGPAIEAILNYSAAMGKDGLEATREFIRATENGGEKLKALGIHFEQTGDKAKDSAKLVALFRDQFKGAGQAQNDSFEAELGRTANALGDVQKAFGSLIAAIDGKLGVLMKARAALGGLEGVFKLAAEDPWLMGTAVGRYMAGQREMQSDVPQGVIRDKLAEIPLLNDPDLAPHVSPGQFYTAPVGPAGKAGSVGAGALGKGLLGGAGAAAKSAKDAADALDKELQSYNETQDYLWTEMRKQEKKNADAMAKAAKDAADKAAEAAKAEADKFKAAGEALGSAFITGMGNQLANLAKGGKFDLGDLLISMLPVVGTVLGGPVGTAAGTAAATVLTAMKSQATMHDGGWVGAPRYHSGTWIGADEHPAILQSGERVLSRAEVQRAGGPSGVDAMARGGGGVTVNVSTFDGSTAREYFERAGGRALLNAVRTGRGAPRLLFGG